MDDAIISAASKQLDATRERRMEAVRLLAQDDNALAEIEARRAEHWQQAIAAGWDPAELREIGLRPVTTRKGAGRPRGRRRTASATGSGTRSAPTGRPAGAAVVGGGPGTGPLSTASQAQRAAVSEPAGTHP